MDTLERTKKDCPAIGTGFCDYVGSEGCAACYIGKVREDEFEKAVESWDVTLSNIPEGIDEFIRTEQCQFCDKESASGYALADIAHTEPKHMKGMFFGFGKKVRSEIGSLMQLPIPICGKCKRNYRISENAPWIACVILSALSLLIFSLIPGMPEESKFGIGLIVLVVMGVLGYVCGKILASAFRAKKSGAMKFNVFEIDYPGKLKEAGWFAMQMDKREIPMLMFSKNMPRPHVKFNK